MKNVKELVYLSDINKIEELANEIIKIIDNKKIIFLTGDLGAGKTTLVKAICKQLGVEDNISSPTFSIINEYQSKGDIIYHMDLYRIESSEELWNIGIEEYFESGKICIIEWPEIASEFVNPDLKINITLVSHKKRQYHLSF
jgi:tRNA threonylcarbamoyladenosine biosynthesis protein TsaE